MPSRSVVSGNGAKEWWDGQAGWLVDRWLARQAKIEKVIIMGRGEWRKLWE